MHPFRLLFVVLSAALLMAACGSDGADVVAGGDDGSPVDEPTEPTPTAPADDQPADPTPSQGEPPADPPDDPPLGGGPYPIADLTVTYEHPDVGTIEYQIVCLGDTATLLGDVDGVNDQAACLALAGTEVQTRLIDGPQDGMCTQQYGGPETARFVGTIDDQPVDTTVNRSDGCGISDWDQLLADLLPPARPFT